MAELQAYHDIVLTYSSTTTNFSVGSNSIIYVFSEGASTSTAGQVFPSSGSFASTVYDIGSFVATNYVQAGLSGPIYRVTSTTATSITMDYVSGTGFTAAINTRLLNIGSSPTKASLAVIYPVDQSTATASTQPLSADSNGNFFFFANTGDYDVLIRNAGNTTDSYIIADITLGAFIRSSATGLVSLQNTADDFSVGGTTLTASAFYVSSADSSVYIGGDTGTRATVDGTNGRVTLVSSGAEPQVLLTNSTGFTGTLTTSHTAARTLTLPDITGTLASLAGTQTFTGAKTFTGGVTVSTAALALTFGMTSTSTAYFQSGLNVGTTDVPTGGDLTAKRLKSNRGTSISVGRFVNTSGWGTGATFAPDTGSTDQRFSFTATAGTTASATCVTTITFEDGTWAAAPFVIAWRNTTGSAPAPAAGTHITWTTTATTVVLTYVFTSAPASTNTAGFTVLVWG